MKILVFLHPPFKQQNYTRFGIESNEMSFANDVIIWMLHEGQDRLKCREELSFL
jgi:hypothetical protein